MIFDVVKLSSQHGRLAIDLKLTVTHISMFLWHMTLCSCDALLRVFVTYDSMFL